MHCFSDHFHLYVYFPTFLSLQSIIFDILIHLSVAGSGCLGHSLGPRVPSSPVHEQTVTMSCVTLHLDFVLSHTHNS